MARKSATTAKKAEVKVEKPKIVCGSCNTCQYRVSIPAAGESNLPGCKRVPSCCFGFKLDFKTDKPAHECGLYTETDYYEKHYDEIEREAKA